MLQLVYLCSKSKIILMIMSDLELFNAIDFTIRHERIYAKIGLMRTDVARNFAISRHKLNHLLTDYAGGNSFPQYINRIRLEEAHELLLSHPEMSLIEIARQIGLTPPNLCRLFKQHYGVAPSQFRPAASK